MDIIQEHNLFSCLRYLSSGNAAKFDKCGEVGGPSIVHDCVHSFLDVEYLIRQ